MSFKDFRVCETLGKGSFASVYKVSWFYGINIAFILTFFYLTKNNNCTFIFHYYTLKINQVIRKSDGKVYALKRIKINKMSKREISDSLNEIRFLASIRHKNIVGFYEVSV